MVHRTSSKIIVGVVAFFLAVSVTPTPPTNTPVEGQKVAAESSSSAAQQTQEQKIEATIQGKLSGQNNLKKPRLHNLVITKKNGGYAVTVGFNVDDNLTANMRFGRMQNDMGELYVLLFSQDLGVKEAIVSAYFPLQDKYGNVSDGLVYQTKLTKDVASKINWSADEIMLRDQIIPGLWDQLFVHPAILP